jgi:cytochrome c oxidase subunit 3
MQMPAAFTHKPGKKQRRAPGIGGLPPVVQRPTGGGNGGGGGDDNWDDGSRGPRELLRRVRFFLFLVLTADMVLFAVLVSIFFAFHSHTSPDTSLDTRTHELVNDWHSVLLPPILYLSTPLLLLSCLTMERARRTIFHEIDALEEWLGMGRPALNRTLPWLGTTLGLGGLFLAGQWMAWRQFAARGFTFDQLTSRASVFFYLFTGLHAAHLLLGAVALVLCLSALGWLRRVEFRQIAVDATAWYWYAMSLVWLMLLAVLALGQ